MSKAPIETAIARQKLNDAIEDERSRLMTAEAVLHCLMIAMNEGAADNARGPDYPSLVALARDLIKQSIDRLDSVRLKPMLQRAGLQGRYEVKEGTVVYVH